MLISSSPSPAAAWSLPTGPGSRSASWVEGLRPEEIAAIHGRFAPGRSLAEDFKARFGQDLDEDAVNEAHEIVIVASALDESTERIVGYLNARDIAINVLFFQVFAHGTDQLLSRAWLLDPYAGPDSQGRWWRWPGRPLERRVLRLLRGWS